MQHADNFEQLHVRFGHTYTIGKVSRRARFVVIQNCKSLPSHRVCTSVSLIIGISMAS